jgi:hypothetical protein
MGKKQENAKRQGSKPRIGKNTRKRRKKDQKGPFLAFLGGLEEKYTPFFREIWKTVKKDPLFGLKMPYLDQNTLFCAKFRPK